ncbi:glycoside hydrolase, partial [Streptomyces sp. SID14478]|uniref:glycosylhydrolase-like jelly roll fold domain-containing protein n=1 Tax=Streptomyces sp. SID14478 TaxID=2706073 RepID=UPI001410392B|nr:glycoside hydrolase [Streptomyces sp. SID14478]
GTAAATLTPHTTDVRVLRLAQGADTAFVVTNERAGALHTTLTVPASGTPEIWDPDTARVAPAGAWRSAAFPGLRAPGTAVDLRIEAKATLVVVVRAASGPAPLHVTSATAPVLAVRSAGRGAVATVVVDGPGTVEATAQDGRRELRGSAEVTDALDPVPLDGDWGFRFDRDGASRQDRPLGDWSVVDAAFSGSALYENSVDLDRATLSGRRWTLDLGDVRDVAEVTVNGTAVGTRLWQPYRVDVTEALRPGRNTVHVRVTNTGANGQGEAAVSGLLGPVLLRPTRTVEIPLSSA